MTNPLQVGIIGTGGMGTRHAHNLAHETVGAQVAAVMDIDRDRAAAVAADCGGAKVFTDASALIADEAVEAVVIASPDPTHATLTLESLTAGKPVLCEKPLATSVRDAKQVLDAEAKGGRQLVQIGLMREYDPPHQALKALIDEGQLGRPLMFRGVHNNLGLGYHRTTEDVIVNSAIHDIHSTRWLMGQEVLEVYVRRVAADPTQPDACRLLIIQMTLSEGGLATIELNADSGYGYEVYVEITGELGKARTTSLQSPTVRQTGRRAQTVESDWLQRFEAAYIREVQSWVASLYNTTPTGPSIWDGYISQVIAGACVRSAQTGRPESVPSVEKPALYA